jgi:cell division protease FtsH
MSKIAAVLVIIGLVLVMLYEPLLVRLIPSGPEPQPTLAFSDFLAEVGNGTVRDVTIQGSAITGHFSDGRSLSTYAPEDPNLLSRLSDRGVRISAAPVEDGVRSMLDYLAFMALLIVAVLLFQLHYVRSDAKATADRLYERIAALEFAHRYLAERLAEPVRQMPPEGGE